MVARRLTSSARTGEGRRGGGARRPALLPTTCHLPPAALAHDTRPLFPLKAHPEYDSSFVLKPMLESNPLQSMNLAADAPKATQPGPFCETDPAMFIRDLGYAATSSVDVFRLLLGEAGALPLTPAATARLLLLFSTSPSLPGGASLSAAASGSGGGEGKEGPIETEMSAMLCNSLLPPGSPEVRAGPRPTSHVPRPTPHTPHPTSHIPHSSLRSVTASPTTTHTTHTHHTHTTPAPDP